MSRHSQLNFVSQYIYYLIQVTYNNLFPLYSKIINIDQQLIDKQIQFDKITPQLLLEQIEEHHKQQINVIQNWQSTPENCLQKIDELLTSQFIYGLSQFLSGVIDGYTEVATKADQLYVEFTSKLYGSKEIRQHINNAICNNQQEERFKEKLLYEFRDQPEELLKEYSKLSNEFQENVKQDQATNVLTIEKWDESMLEGLSDSVKQYIIKDGKIVLDSTGFIKQNINNYAKSEELRKQYWIWNQTVCMNNTENAEKQLLQKQKIAEFYNKKNICEENLQNKMAKTPETVEKFLLQIKDIAMKKYLEDGQYLEKTFNCKIEPWNINYLIEQLKVKETNFDMQKFSNYFEAERTIQKIFEFLQRMYDVTIQKNNLIGWHEDVQCFTVTRNQDNKFLSILYYDPYQRKFKRPGAWMDTIGNNIVIVCTNIQPKQEGRHCMQFGDIETILHEFGHAFHYIMSETQIKYQKGTNVAWDFVEVPSQFNENFAYQKQFLNEVGLDEQGNKITDQQLQQLIKRKQFMNSHFVMTQIMYGYIDYKLHINQDWNNEVADEQSSKIDKFCTKILEGIRYPYEYGKSHEIKTIYRHFLHIFSSIGGYTCGYYGYFWADVIQAHLFKYMEKHQNFNEYVKNILQPGDSIDANILINRYCGGFSFDAWKEMYGLN